MSVVHCKLSIILQIFLLFLLCLFVVLEAGCSSFNSTSQNREPLGVVQTLAGAGELRFGEVFGIAIDKDGMFFVSDGANGKIYRIEQNGATNLITDKLDTPSGIVVDKDSLIIVADAGTHTIKRVNPANGEISLVAGVENKAGFADGATNSALFNAPLGIAISEGKIFVADTYNDRLRIIENGTVRTLAGSEKGFGDSVTGLEAKFDTPCGVAIEKDGSVLVADTGNRRIRRITADGTVSTFAGNGEWGTKNGWNFQATFAEPIGIAIDEFGAIYVSDAGANAIRVFGRRFAPFWETLSGKNGRGTLDGELSKAEFNRPTNAAIDSTGRILVADSANKLVRVVASEKGKLGNQISPETVRSLFLSAEQLRTTGEPRWTYNPPDKPRDVAGTFGELRGEIKTPADYARFHNGLDIAGATGETARFIRDEKVLRPVAAENFGNLRELLRMPTIGYIHINLGREANGKTFEDARFLFTWDANGKPNSVRVPRGSKFKSGEPVGTLNPMNHVHLIAGETGAEMNAFAALVLPGAKDTIAPKIEKIILFDENWREIKSNESLRGQVRIVVNSFDQMDGNAARRRLGVYKLGFQILDLQNTAVLRFEQPKMTISFEKLPRADGAANLVYAIGSRDNVFNYIVSNFAQSGAAREDFFDTSLLPNGEYKIRVFAADFFGNQTTQDLPIKIIN